MKRLYSNVSSAQGSLQKRPEILYALRVDLTAKVFLGVVYNVMHETIVQFVVSHGIVGVDGRAVLHVIQDRVLQGFPFDVRNDHCSDLAEIPVEHPHDDSLVLEWPQALNLDSATLVHVLGNSPDECLISLNRATFPAAKLATTELSFPHRFAEPLKHEPCR